MFLHADLRLSDAKAPRLAGSKGAASSSTSIHLAILSATAVESTASSPCLSRASFSSSSGDTSGSSLMSETAGDTVSSFSPGKDEDTEDAARLLSAFEHFSGGGKDVSVGREISRTSSSDMRQEHLAGTFANMVMLCYLDFMSEMPAEPCTLKSLIAASWCSNSAAEILSLPLSKSSLSFLHFCWIVHGARPPTP